MCSELFDRCDSVDEMVSSSGREAWEALVPVTTLSHAQILALHRAAVVAGLAQQRPALLAGIAPAFVAGLPSAADPSSQMLVDLHAMNAGGTLEDGSVPLALWLASAVAVCGGRPEAQGFIGVVDSFPISRPDPRQALFGAWQVDIERVGGRSSPLASFEMRPEGTFSGRFHGGPGAGRIEGTWWLVDGRRLELRGTLGRGRERLPYEATIRLTFLAPDTMAGTTHAGERLVWRRDQPAPR